MKLNIIILLTAITLSGCRTVPEKPEPQSDKYTFQIVAAHVPYGVMAISPMQEQIPRDPNLLAVFYKQYQSEQITRIFTDDRIKLDLFPLVELDEGQLSSVDQTTPVMLPEDYSIVDGKAVANQKNYKIGTLISVTLDEVDTALQTITYTLALQYQKIKGFDEIALSKEVKVSMPILEKREINTSVTQTYDAWLLMGGIVEEDSNGKKGNLIFCARVIPPSEDASTQM